jgi:hypothetical protein
MERSTIALRGLALTGNVKLEEPVNQPLPELLMNAEALLELESAKMSTPGPEENSPTAKLDKPIEACNGVSGGELK